MNEAAREQIRTEAIRLWPSVTDDDLGRVEREFPTLYYLIERKTLGLILDGKTATDVFLRTLPEEHFNRLLVLVMTFWRSANTGIEQEAIIPPELTGLAVTLLRIESGVDIDGREDAIYQAMDRLTHLTLIEERRRAGAYAMVGRYSLLAKVDDCHPPRLPVIDRRTEH